MWFQGFWEPVLTVRHERRASLILHQDAAVFPSIFWLLSKTFLLPDLSLWYAVGYFSPRVRYPLLLIVVILFFVTSWQHQGSYSIVNVSSIWRKSKKNQIRVGNGSWCCIRGEQERSQERGWWWVRLHHPISCKHSLTALWLRRTFSQSQVSSMRKAVWESVDTWRDEEEENDEAWDAVAIEGRLRTQSGSRGWRNGTKDAAREKQKKRRKDRSKSLCDLSVRWWFLKAI